jgi:hypothetical protein
MFKVLGMLCEESDQLIIGRATTAMASDVMCAAEGEWLLRELEEDWECEEASETRGGASRGDSQKKTRSRVFV